MTCLIAMPAGAPAITRTECVATGFIAGTDRVVVLNTGTGLKYPETIPVDVPTLPVGGAIPQPG